MTTVRMLELVLLNQLDYNLQQMSDLEYEKFVDKYNISKISDRSKELTDEFLGQYAYDKGVTA